MSAIDLASNASNQLVLSSENKKRLERTIYAAAGCAQLSAVLLERISARLSEECVCEDLLAAIGTCQDMLGETQDQLLAAYADVL